MIDTISIKYLNNYVEKNKNILYNQSTIILKTGVAAYGTNSSKENRNSTRFSRRG